MLCLPARPVAEFVPVGRRGVRFRNRSTAEYLHPPSERPARESSATLSRDVLRLRHGQTTTALVLRFSTHASPRIQGRR
jgi:hypothetical protein